MLSQFHHLIRENDGAVRHIEVNDDVEYDCHGRAVGDDIALLARYGVRVPVLRLEPAGRELAWPFDARGLEEFLRAYPADTDAR